MKLMMMKVVVMVIDTDDDDDNDRVHTKNCNHFSRTFQGPH